MSTSSAQDLQAVLASLPFTMDDQRSAELRERVCAFVDEMKGRDLPPERILSALKRIAHDAGVRPASVTSSGVKLEPEGIVLQQLVRWCIEH
jgi:hypothetical protein